jgi:hypothetical protein
MHAQSEEKTGIANVKSVFARHPPRMLLKKTQKVHSHGTKQRFTIDSLGSGDTALNGDSHRAVP